MSVNTVIFDLDGTLLDTLDDLTGAVNYCMRLVKGPRHDREQVRQNVGNGIYVLMEKSLPGGRSNPCYDECMSAFRPYYEKHMLDHTAPYDGIEQALSCLSARGYRLAIVSNKFDEAVKRLNKRFFDKYISVAIGENEAGGVRKKPAPDTVLRAMRDLGSKPEECVYVGDSDVDILTAANAEIPCISVTWGFKTPEFLLSRGAEHLAYTPAALTDMILRFNH